MALNEELVELLACPKCKGSLVRNNEPDGFACNECNLLYKIEDEIPNFIIEEADPLVK